MYATTAANPDESSYACYLDSQLETYLGDCYSVNWMENVDKVRGHTVLRHDSQYSLISNCKLCSVFGITLHCAWLLNEAGYASFPGLPALTVWPPNEAGIKAWERS